MTSELFQENPGEDSSQESGEAAGAQPVAARPVLWRPLLLGILLVAGVLLAYQPVWRAGYIWDDDVYVTTNQLLTAPDGLQRIWFSFDSPSQYFPLVYTTFRIEHAFWGLDPAGYHWVNLVLHAVNALLLWRLLSVLRIPGAWLAAAIFALHPVQVESVAWITERKNVLMGLFFLLVLLAWRRFIEGTPKSRWVFYALALLAFALSLASKTTACTLPAALLLMLWWKREAIGKSRWLQIGPFVFLGLGAGLISMWWERYHQGTEGGIFTLGILERVMVAARAFWFYLGKLFWPFDLAFSYPRWPIFTGQWTDYLWVGACVLLVLLIWCARRFLGRGPEVAALFYAATLSPMLGFVMLYTFRYSFVADHYVYLASIGPIALVAAGLTLGMQRVARGPVWLIPVLCAALLLPLGVRTWQQSGIYKNEETLWRATIAVNPDSWMAQNNLAIHLLHSGRSDEAIPHFEEALRLDPNYAEAHYNLGNALFRIGRIEEARTHYERALQLIPEFAAARYNFAILLRHTGEIPAALEQLERAIKIDPKMAAARQLLGETLLRAGRAEDAVKELQAAIAIQPNASEAYNRLAAAYFQQGLPEEASQQAQRLSAADPKSAVVQVEAGKIVSALGKDVDARTFFEKAVQLDPQNAEAHFNLGNSLLAGHQIDEAMEQYRQAVENKTDYAEARLNLGNTLLEKGRVQDAALQYEKVIEIEPDYALAHRNLSSALNGLGRFDEAFEHMQTAWKIEAAARKGGGAPPR
ncbi:MAG: tetratricopeptide repeat protein [Chthoniobacterales bacterium]